MHQLALFDNLLATPATEGIKYAGSKLKLLPYILDLVSRTGAKSVVDVFSGTTRVSQALAKSGYNVICNDISVWSENFGNCFLINQKPPKYFKPFIDYLNSVPPIDGWFTHNYGGDVNNIIQSDGLKKPWQIHNTRKLDAIRKEIEGMDIDRLDKSVLLTSLIFALDQVDNTLGHFASYLRDWSPRSYNNLVMKLPNLVANSGEHMVFREDAFQLSSHVGADLAYLDPPYGSNNDKMPPSRVRYAAYYHIWTTICLADNPDLFGKAKRRKDSSDTVSSSVFEDFRKDEAGRYVSVNAIDKLVGEINSNWVVLSYSSGGRATAEELNEVLRRHGKLLDVLKIDHNKNVMSSMSWTNEWLRDSDKPNKEFLFLLEK